MYVADSQGKLGYLEYTRLRYRYGGESGTWLCNLQSWVVGMHGRSSRDGEAAYSVLPKIVDEVT